MGAAVIGTYIPGENGEDHFTLRRNRRRDTD